MLIELAERRILPDRLVRRGMRRLLRARLREETLLAAKGNRHERLKKLFASGPIAIETAAANEQHYEVPTAFYQQMLGPRLKYSSCWWPDNCQVNDRQALATAEIAMLQLTCQRAQCADGQRILELGCGWGSLTLWLAEQYPQSQIVAVSNSRVQQAFIQQQCRQRQLTNVEVRVHNVAELKLEEKFDRVLSVEMFEHMRNWQQLLTNVAAWLTLEGKCFLHTFCHCNLFYPFNVTSSTDWMAKHFFSGGVMPSYDLLEQLEIPLRVESQWEVNGNHYAKTCQAWLANLDAASSNVIRLFAADLGRLGASRQLARWRMFVMACEELFAWDDGQQWFVSHTLLEHSGD